MCVGNRLAGGAARVEPDVEAIGMVSLDQDLVHAIHEGSLLVGGAVELRLDMAAWDNERVAGRRWVGVGERDRQLGRDDEYALGVAEGAAHRRRLPPDAVRSTRAARVRYAFLAMRFWWVNQNQTFEQEFRGGYLWSPKRNRNGARNQFYENMREVAPGDVVFSFRNRAIAAIGVAQSYGYECPKPTEFGTIGANWEQVGWRVDMLCTVPSLRAVPKEHMGVLGPLMPERYAPLQANGDGIQSVYLTELPTAFAETLAGLVGAEAQQLVAAARDQVPRVAVLPTARGIDEWEDQIQRSVEENGALSETDRVALVKARRGQGVFKQNVMRNEAACRITRVENVAHLVGSHIKPWRDSNNDERLDGANGLLLTPSIDHLFDRGFISFRDNGDLLVSPVAERLSLQRMGVATEGGVNVGRFSPAQARYLEFHRDDVFLKATRSRA